MVNLKNNLDVFLDNAIISDVLIFQGDCSRCHSSLLARSLPDLPWESKQEER